MAVDFNDNDGLSSYVIEISRFTLPPSRFAPIYETFKQFLGLSEFSLLFNHYLSRIATFIYNLAFEMLLALFTRRKTVVSSPVYNHFDITVGLFNL